LPFQVLKDNPQVAEHDNMPLAVLLALVFGTIQLVGCKTNSAFSQARLISQPGRCSPDSLRNGFGGGWNNHKDEVL
jgi:hypothetical protein